MFNAIPAAISFDYIPAMDSWVNDTLLNLSDNSGHVFDFISNVLDGFNGGILWLLTVAPFYIVALGFGILGWYLVRLRFGVLVAIGLILCQMMGLWSDTMSTLSLVVAATILALVVAIPCGVVTGYVPWLYRLVEPALDLLQTLPPYIYLLPGIALLGYGPATALAATFIVALPPAFRLTALGIRLTPIEYLELGEASGTRPWQMFFKIRLPFAAPSIMTGINQTLMMAFGMVVIAGIVGSGGLGQTIYEAILRLEIGKSIDAAIAIVILTIILDRLSQQSAQGRETAGS